MRLISLLSEALNANTIKQLSVVALCLGISEEKLINIINTIDPLNNHIEWILRQIKHKNILVPEDNHRVKEAINLFKQNQSRLLQKDLNQYKTINDLEETLEKVTGTASKRRGGFQVNPFTLSGVKLINQDSGYKLWEITNQESLKEMGEGTKWCTRKSYPTCQAEYYINRYGTIYLISKNEIPYTQFTKNFVQIKDVNDEHTNLANFKQLLKVLEPTLIKDPKGAFFYANDVLEEKWPEAEPYIMKNPKWSFFYARDILKKRWPEAESRIMKDPISASYYASEVYGKRWPEAEPYIMKNVTSIFRYACNVLKRRWPEAEPYIMKSPKYAYFYTIKLIGGRWPEAEPYIMKNPKYAERYMLRYISNQK